MEKFIKIAINVTKYGALSTDKNGNQWLNISGYLKEEKDQYGRNGFVKREAGKGESHRDMPIVGNFMVIDFNASKNGSSSTNVNNDDNDLPF